MSDVIRLKVDGDQIKSARKAAGQHHPALRIFLPGQAEQRNWGGRVSGELRVFRSRIEDEFEIHILTGRFEPGSPHPVLTEAKPWKHVSIQQSLRHQRLDALVACCNGNSWYHHDVRIIGDSEIVYDRNGRGFRVNVQLWIQTRGKVLKGNGPWQSPVLRTKSVSPNVLSESDLA